MYIKLHDFSSCTSAFLKESILPSLTAQQKKIILVASIALGILAAVWYVMNRCSFAAKPLDGPVKITYEDGSIDEGEYKNGDRDGLWKLTKTDGSVMEAEYIDGQANGPAKATHADGSVLLGEYKNGKPHGIWQKTASDGTVLELVYEDGIRKESNGKQVNADGSVFEIQIKDGDLVHTFKETSPDGTVIEGEFKGDDLYGKVTNPDGTQSAF